MDLKQALPDTVSLFHDNIEWIHLIDYEHVPFRCRKCHDLGHLYKDCPPNRKPPPQMDSDNPAFDGFTKVVNCRIGHNKSTANTRTNPANLSKPSTSNSFAALASDDVQDPDNIPLNDKETSKEKQDGVSLQPGGNLSGKSTHHIQSKFPAWSFHGMEVDNPELSTKAVGATAEEFQEPQLMEEDSENIDISELDILGLEQA